LGCTHYPLLKPILQSVTGHRVKLIDSAEETAKDVAKTLRKNNLLNSSRNPGRMTFFVTDNPTSFALNGRKFFGPSLPPARLLRFDSV
jgi:glutamate racemase